MNQGFDALEIERTHGSGAYQHRDLTLVRGEGCRLFDDQGKEYLDATSMYGVTSLGHAHPALTAAISAQAARLVACFSTFANDTRAQLLATMAEIFSPFDRFFLCNSGTEAVEAAMKMARVVTGRTRIVALSRGFHGRTMGALSATHRLSHREPFLPLIPDVDFVSVTDEDALREAITDATAAVLFEPIQGEGGVFPLPHSTLQLLRELTTQHGALLIADEVQTGCGRTGAWLASVDAGITSDLVCLAKGLGGGVPIGALAIAPHLSSLTPGAHGSTFGGSPLACAAALATLRTLRDDDLLAHARSVGAHAFARLSALNSPAIREVRGRGLMIGIELKTRVASLMRTLQEQGFLVLSAGTTVVRLLPPLIMTMHEMDLLLDALECSLLAHDPRGQQTGADVS